MISPAPISSSRVDLLRRNRSVVSRLAERHGLSDLRVTKTGRLLVSVAEDRTYVDIAEFDAAVEDALGVAIDAIPDGVLEHRGHSEDLDLVVPL
ncbi:MAG: hypothetical protein ACRD0K_10880 [Egibacteraceae bacterium]